VARVVTDSRADGCLTAELEPFHRVGRFLSSILDLNQLLRAILEEALATVGATRAFVALVDRRRGELILRFTAGTGWEREQRRRRIKISDAPGHGITSYVAATGLPYVSGDVTRDPRYVMYFPDVQSELAVPLLDRHGRTIGVLNLEDERPNAFSPQDQQLMVALASQASIAITVADYRAREAALIEIGSELNAIGDPGQLMQRVIRTAAALLRADECSLFTLDTSRERLILRASRGPLAKRIGEATYRLGEGLTGWVAEHACAARVADVLSDPRWRGLYPERPPEEIDAYLAVPITGREGLLGVLRAVRRKRATLPLAQPFGNHFTEEDEALLTTLAGQVGAALTQQRLVDRLVQTERMAAWGELSARTAHMIGNRVFAIKGHLNELEHRLASPPRPGEELRELVGQIKQGVFRLEEILQEFRDFVMATQVQTAEVSLAELLQSVTAEAAAAGLAIRLEVAPDLPHIPGDASRLRRAFEELVENAAHHQAAGGGLVVTAGPVTSATRTRLLGAEGSGEPLLPAPGDAHIPEPGVVVEFIDRGPGIPPKDKDRLFQPFFTTRAKGMGLGLSIVKGILDAHGGSIREVGRPGEGAHFLILLPALGGA
jgi:signal transduction histidine kinase